MHNNLQDLMSKELREADIHHSGGRFGHTRTCEGVFSAEVNGGLPLPNDDEEGAKWLRGIIPDLIIHGNGLSEPKERDPSGLRLPDEETIADFKTLGPGRSYTVDSRQRRVTTEYTTHAQKLDQKTNGTSPDTRGPVEAKLREFNDGHVCGPVAGPFGEISSHFNLLLAHIAEEKAARHCHYYDVTISEARNLHLQLLRRKVCHAIHQGWAMVLEQNLRTHRPTREARPTETPDAAAEAEEQMDCDVHVFRNGMDGGDFNVHA